MNVFMQGMRRSGTTIAFDILWEDGNFNCYYEPLSTATDDVFGGGSGMRSVDFYENVRQCRASFMKKYPHFHLEKINREESFCKSVKNIMSLKLPMIERENLLNYGAPRKPALEFETDLPDYAREYIKFMTSQAEHTMIKFTRMFSKIRVLWEIDPKAKFIHIVRDPRSVTASFFFGKKQRQRNKFPNEDIFFESGPEVLIGASRTLSEVLLQTHEYSYLHNCKAYMRVMLLWKIMFQRTHDDGQALFRNNYFLFRHENLLSEPEQTLKTLYEFLELPLPKHVLEWVQKNINRTPSFFAPDNPRWHEAVKKIKMEEELKAAGYEYLI
ncbi:MAG: sulfotransferase [Candidatus Kuenenia sp.]|nr:sulfotransferase [Candidatus Kuenenia hertensis]